MWFLEFDYSLLIVYYRNVKNKRKTDNERENRMEFKKQETSTNCKERDYS